MAIIQISRIQHRSGNLVDLPQLSDAEFGWATDKKRLFIGKSSPNENIEVLTSYSNVNFSQIIGAYGNLNISNTASDGQVLSYDATGNTWINKGGVSGGLIDLGSVDDIKIAGGAIGYVLETDGTGSLAWSPKGTLVVPIISVTPTTFTGSIANVTVNAGSFVVGEAYSIKDTGTTTIWNDVGATADTPGTVFIASAAGVGDGTAYLTTLDVSIATSGDLQIGMCLNGAGIATGTYVAQFGSGTGGIGTYYLSKPLSVSSEIITGPMIMKVLNTVLYTVPYVNGVEVTITGVVAANADTIINGQSFYGTLSTDYATTGNVALYIDIGRTVASTGTTLGQPTANGVATSVISTGGGGATVGGSNTTIQFNNNNILDGKTGFTYDYTTNLMTLNGNANVGNLNATGIVTATRLFSNVATGTTPIQVISTTLVPNLYVARANVSDYSVVATQTTGVFYPTFVSANTTANYALGSNANLSFNAATGTLSSTLLTGTLTTAAQPNVTSVGTLAGLVVSGHITPSANITYNLGNNTNRFNDLYLANSTIYIGAQTISANATSVTISGSIVGNMSGNATTAGTVTTAAQPNVTSVGTLTSLSVNGTASAGNLSTGGTLSVTGNANVGNLGATGLIVAIGNISGANLTGNHYGSATALSSLTGANVTGQVNYAATANAVAGGNVSGAVSFATTANAVAGANVSGAVAYATTANAVAGGNVSGTVGLATYATTANAVAAANISGTINYATYAGTANSVAGGNVSGAVSFATTANAVAGANVSGQVNYAATANAVAGGNVSGTVANATYAVTAGSTTTVTAGGTVTTTNLTTGATATAGTITGNWSLATGSQLRATYADLAECYKADAYYEAGTVLEFGGMNEVTVASDSTNRVAGVVSTNPAYVMNSLCEGEYIVQLALQGRTPCKVRGNVRKGDMMVSGGDGFARPSASPLMGTVIGKSLEDFTGTSGVIEVAVGRL